MPERVSLEGAARHWASGHDDGCDDGWLYFKVPCDHGKDS
jgi:hypothetical protein